jgi:hypothetical protein
MRAKLSIGTVLTSRWQMFPTRPDEGQEACRRPAGAAPWHFSCPEGRAAGEASRGRGRRSFARRVEVTVVRLPLDREKPEREAMAQEHDQRSTIRLKHSAYCMLWPSALRRAQPWIISLTPGCVASI